MTDFLKIAQERYSVRQFKNTPIEQEKLELILKAGQCAPTAGNFQPQRIYIVESDNAKQIVRQFTKCLFTAPCAIIVCYEISEAWRCPLDDYCSGQDEAAIVATQMMLEAHELGLGTLWVRGFDGTAMRDALGIPQSQIICSMLTVGYPAEEAKPAPVHFRRKPLDATVKIL